MLFKRCLRAIALCLALSICSTGHPRLAAQQPAKKTYLIIEVEGFADTTGIACVGLLDDPNAFKTADMRKERKEVQRYYRSLVDLPIRKAGNTGKVVCRIDDLTPGEYAAFTFQDRNRNARLDSNVIGLPLEPFGMSNDVRPQLLPIPKPPTWKAAAFTVRPGENRITIHMQN